MNYPRKTPHVHIEAIGDELCVYDWRRRRVHALNPSAALVWQHCDGATPAETIADVLGLRLGAADARALVSVTLQELANAGLLVEPVEVSGHDAARRVLLQRGIAAALLPVVYSIVAPEPLAAQSPAAPTLTGIAPGSGARSVTVTVTLTGTNFAAGTTTVALGGSGVTVANVNVITPTSLTADFLISGAAALGPRAVTITTPAGISGVVTFTIGLFVTTFDFTVHPQSFTVPPGVTSLTTTAFGGAGGGAGTNPPARGGFGGSITATIDVTPGETLTIFVGGAGLPGIIKGAAGGFNGGGVGAYAFPAGAGGGGGASDVRRGAAQLADRVIVAGGGGGAGVTAIDSGGPVVKVGAAVAGGAGGGAIGGSGANSAGATGGAGGTQSAGGAGGAGGTRPGNSGSLGNGGNGGDDGVGFAAGGGGGGGLFGGGGGGAGSGGGGGSSAAAVSARNVTTTSGDRAGDGQVIISF